MATVIGHMQNNPRKTWARLLLGIFLLLVVLGVGSNVFHWTWTGFQGQTLWDWMNLLITPILVAILPIVLGGFQDHADSAPSASEQEQQVVSPGLDDSQYRATLEAYQEHMTELLLEKNLSNSQPGSDVREVARAQTLTALRLLDRSYKGDILLFLHEAGLIYKGKVIVDLRDADLGGADLSNAKLNGADLSGVDFSHAKLNGASLRWADLRNVKLSGADLSGADLRESSLHGTDLSDAKLSGANLEGALYT